MWLCIRVTVFHLLALCSWKKCSSELRSRDRVNPDGHVAGPQMMGLRSEDFGYRMGAVSNFYAQPSTSITSNNVENPVGPMFSGVITSSSWCPVSWTDPGLGPSSCRKGMEWAKSLQDSAGEVDSLFQRSEFERSWRNRTSSDGGGMSPHKNVSVNSPSYGPHYKLTLDHGCFWHVKLPRVVLCSWKKGVALILLNICFLDSSFRSERLWKFNLQSSTESQPASQAKGSNCVCFQYLVRR